MFKNPYKSQIFSAFLFLSALFIMSSFYFKSAQEKENTLQQKFQKNENSSQLSTAGKNLNKTGSAKSNNYIFDPAKWEIVEGKVSDEVALNNRLQLEAAFREAVEKKADTFKIDRLDAYFNVSTITQGRNSFESWKEGITIPSNFNLEMSTETHIRAQPNNLKRYALLTNGTNDNISITGGNLYGERNEHIYSGKSTDEWGHVIDLIGLENATIDGVSIKDANGDGMKIRELNFTFEANHDKSRNIKIINCTFDTNRRNNLAVTSGTNILIEGNTFLNAGQDTNTSKGTSPKAAIDIEPYTERSKKTGELIHYEKAEDIIIRNNIEKSSAWQGFTVATGRAVLIESNEMESSINFGYSDSVIIRNNSLINPGMGGIGMELGEEGDRVFDNEVYNNLIKNFKEAMAVEGNGHKIYENTCSNYDRGLRIYDLKDSKIFNNKFTSNRSKSYGLFIHVTTVENSIIKENSFSSDRAALKIFNMNYYGKQDKNIQIEKNRFVSNQSASIGNSNGVNLINNQLNTDLKIMGADKLLIKNNTINAGKKIGVVFIKENKNIKLLNNKINTSKICIHMRERPENLIKAKNTCLN